MTRMALTTGAVAPLLQGGRKKNMPKVGGKKFPYTKAGEKAAEVASEKSGKPVVKKPKKNRYGMQEL